MARRHKSKRSDVVNTSSARRGWTSTYVIPLLLVAITFLVYTPSLAAGFVYDAHVEILEEGFITSLSNLAAVLSLKVLAMPLMLSDRPGQLLFMMLIAAIWGKTAWGYHLCSNLIHTTNVALLFGLLRRLIAAETGRAETALSARVQVAMGAVCLIFALHPLAVESVAEISYSSALLTTFFTLLALLAATAFRPENKRSALTFGGLGTLCAFASVSSKESGVATALLLVVYWLLFRRGEAKGPWLGFIVAAITVTVLFLVARFSFVKPGSDMQIYLGGSLGQVFLIQPGLWLLMMGKLIWPFDLSANYTLEDLHPPPAFVAIPLLFVVVAAQIWLARKSRVAALGVAFYWLGLATVSNFVPIYQFLADRFYYLPLAGVAMQLLPLLLMLKVPRTTWRFALAAYLVLVPLTLLTIYRQFVFIDDLSFWTDTLRVSPHSGTAHLGLGWIYAAKGRTTDAISEYEKALETDSGSAVVHANLGIVLAQRGEQERAIAEFQKALQRNPNYTSAHYDLGNSYWQQGKLDDAIAQYREAVAERPDYSAAFANLGVVFFQKGQVDESIDALEHAVKIDPDYFEAHYNLGLAYANKGRMYDAVDQFQEAVRINPGDTSARNNLARARGLLQQGVGGK